MAIEINDLNMVTDEQDSQFNFLNSSTTSQIRGGYNPYDPQNAYLNSKVPDPAFAQKPNQGLVTSLGAQIHGSGR